MKMSRYLKRASSSRDKKASLISTFLFLSGSTKHPQILVLDDSSSALDYATDARLRRAIQENYGDLTSIIVAQRISSIYRADKIIVLEDGEMIGYGTHKNLMESCEVYREISQSQMGGGIDEA